MSSGGGSACSAWGASRRGSGKSCGLTPGKRGNKDSAVDLSSLVLLPQDQSVPSDQVCPVLVVNGARLAEQGLQSLRLTVNTPMNLLLRVPGQVHQCPRPVSSPPPEEIHASSRNTGPQASRHSAFPLSLTRTCPLCMVLPVHVSRCAVIYLTKGRFHTIQKQIFFRKILKNIFKDIV